MTSKLAKLHALLDDASLAQIERVTAILAPEPTESVIDATSALRVLLPHLAGQRIEVLAGAFLNSRSRVIASEVLSNGGVDHAIIDPRHILRRALLLNARAVVLAHNHPSGDHEPSQIDVESTMKLRSAFSQIGLTLLDHVVVSNTGYTSMATVYPWNR